MDIDIPSLSTALSAVRLNSAVGTQVLANSLDLNRQYGDSLTNMIDSASLERSVNPSIGSNFDMSV